MSLQIQLDRLLNNISEIFFKEISGNVYKFFLSVANELFLTEEMFVDLKTQININTSTGDSLDLHGQSFGLFRSLGEGDLSFRSRILASFIRPQITKPRLIEAVSDLSSTTPIIEEYIIDKWFIGGTPKIDTITELLSANGNQFTTTNSIALSSFPDIFPFYDTAKTGTNYGSGATVDDTTIDTAISLPASGISYQVTYTPAITDSTPVSAVDMYANSFIEDNIILHPNNTHNNAGIRWLEESLSGTTIALSADIFTQTVDTITTITGQTSSGYGVDIEWWDEDNNHVYRWRTSADKNGIIRFDEGKRIDSEIGSERNFTDTDAGSSVNTSFDISNVIGVFDGSDSQRTGTNYYIETVTEAVTSINKEYIEVAYDIVDIESIYVNDDLTTDKNYWESCEGKGNFFLSNKIYLKSTLPKNIQPLVITYVKTGGFTDGNKIILSQNTSVGQEVIVQYRKNPIIDYQDISFYDLLYAGHGDTKFTFEVQIQQSVIKWGDSKKYGEGWKWAQFDNNNTQTSGEIIDTSKAAGTKAFIVVIESSPSAGYTVYGQTYYGYIYV